MPSLSGPIHSLYHPCQTRDTPYAIPVGPYTLLIPSLPGPVHSLYHPCQTLYTPYANSVSPYTLPVPSLSDPVHSLYKPCQTLYTPSMSDPIQALSDPIHTRALIEKQTSSIKAVRKIPRRACVFLRIQAQAARGTCNDIKGAL